MSYYPILSAPHCTGETTLYNFPPNNWESVKKNKQYVHLTYAKDNLWHSKILDELDFEACIKLNRQDLRDLIPEGIMPLLSLSRTKLPRVNDYLPVLDCNHTHVPEYRSTMALRSNFTVTSYQGEVNPFPNPASLLTPSPFLQFGEDIENYLLLLNMEKLPTIREAKLEVYDAYSRAFKKIQSIYNNQISIVSLDGLGFDKHSLPIAICRQMAAIPFYFSSYKHGELLSLEHTHAPASLVTLGNRFSAQSDVKKYWFSELCHDK